jgi:predicted outer membrane repeat protein
MLQRAWSSLIGRDRENGQALVLFVAGLVGFLGIVGLSIDVGHKMWARTDQQKAADAAAIAAINQYLDSSDKAVATQKAKDYALSNGYAANMVTVTWGPTSGPNVGNTDAVEVIIEKPLTKYFIGMVYPGQWKAKARAVAKLDVKQVPFGVITLNPTACQSLSLDANSQLHVTGGAVIVNSNCEPDAMHMDANAQMTGELINITGTYTNAGNNVLTPVPSVHQPAVPDPFASIPIPPYPAAGGGGPSPNVTKSWAGNNPAVPNCNNPPNAIQNPVNYNAPNGEFFTFNPGRYKCRVHLMANTVAIFKAGNYTFEGGFEMESNSQAIWERGTYTTMGFGFKMKSNSWVKDPAAGLPRGALLYNTCSSPCGTAGPIQIDAGAHFEVTKYGDPYANILIFQDRNATAAVSFSSNNVTAGGAIYTKSAHIEYYSNVAIPLQFVADTVQMNSNAVLNVNVAGMSTASIKTANFVE